MYNILVCDDDKEIVEAIEIYLTQEGYRILKAYDGTEALEMLEREEVHLLLLDVMMPKLDGFSAVKEIRKDKDVPVIMLSARGEEYGNFENTREKQYSHHYPFRKIGRCG